MISKAKMMLLYLCRLGTCGGPSGKSENDETYQTSSNRRKNQGVVLRIGYGLSR